MKVKELLEKLKAFDPDHNVICYCEDKGVVNPGHGFRLFDITNIYMKDAENTRVKDGVPSLKFGKTEYSLPHALIEISSDF